MAVTAEVQLSPKKTKIMKILKLKISILLIFIITSCDCLQHVQGVVIDAKTNLPIEKVAVKEDSRAWIIYTDSVGTFEFTSMTGGLFSCPKISLSFEKEGYGKVTKKYKSCCSDHVIVILEKQTD